MKKNHWIGIGAAGVVLGLVATLILVNLPKKVPPPSGPEDDGVKKEPLVSENVAPPHVSLAKATEFLYTGANARQTGVKEGTIVPKRAAVLRGKITNREGEALSGVNISIHHRHEFGRTVSGADGIFDLAVNGGGQLCVNYQKDGYLPSCRHIAVPWQDYAWLPDVVLIPSDNTVSAIDLKAEIPVQVARGGVVKDKDGERQATLFISQGTEATVKLPDGSKKALTKLSVRATEYTVGARGPDSMPAALPPNSAYTYAVELGADEGAAENITFSKPLIYYVENFLKFPVGLPVPVGYFDRDKNAWIPSDNGRVIKILSVKDGLADLDLDDKGQAAAGALTKLGITEAERRQLASLYKPGQSLWRLLIPHFSSWDANLARRVARGATGAKSGGPDGDHNGESCQGDGSVIEIQKQALGETAAIAGTPFTMHYQSDRVPGRKAARSLTITLSGEKVPESLKRIELEVLVAGQRLFKEFPPQPNQSYTFTWDGKDAYGRLSQGPQAATIRIGYVYDASYERTDQFASFGTGDIVTGSFARMEGTIWQGQQAVLGTWEARSFGLGGWGLDVLHAYHPSRQILYLGDGRQRSGQSIPPIITTVAGSGIQFGFEGDGGKAIDAKMNWPTGIALAPDGSLYIAAQLNHCIRRVSPDGIITTVAGIGVANPSAPGAFEGDDGPATKARLNNPIGVALSPDGSLYIADSHNNRVRRVAPDGIITTVAGGGTDRQANGVQATQARLDGVSAVAFGPDGCLYVADLTRIFRLGPDNVINVVAGGSDDAKSERILARNAYLRKPNALVCGPDGSLYIAESYRVRRVSPEGIISTVAGTGEDTGLGDGALATRAWLEPTGIALGPNGSLYIAESHARNCIRQVTADGIIKTVAGQKENGFRGDGGPANKAHMSGPCGIAVASDGSLYVAVQGNNRVRRIYSQLPGLSPGEITVPDEGGLYLYVFDGEGRHLRTLHSLTQAVLYRFAYDDRGRLLTIEDANGNVTRVEREAGSGRIAIVAPFGQRTTLSLDANGYLAAIANPAGETTELSYVNDGLLASLKDPRGNVSRFTFDDLGRLIKDENAAGGFSSLARTKTARGFEVGLTTAEKPATTYLVEKLPTGEESRLNKCCCGAETKGISAADGASKVSYPDGTVANFVPQADPRWGMMSPLLKTFSLMTPGGLTGKYSLDRQITLGDASNPLSLRLLTDTWQINGRKYTSIFDVPKKLVTRRTPAGRETATTVDEYGQVLKAEVPGLHPILFSYDKQGRLISIKQGEGEDARAYGFEYSAAGRLAAVANPLKQTNRFEHDQAGRVVKSILSDDREIAYAHDANGFLKSITPPGRPAHVFDYTSGNLIKDYQPPDAGDARRNTSYEYNLDKQWTKISRPDGKNIEATYDKVGHLDTVTMAGAKLQFAFDTKTDLLKSIASPDGTLSYSYDGFLLTGTTWDGVVKGTVTRKHDNDFRVAGMSVNGGPAVEFKRDPDGLLVKAGDLTLERDPRTGLLKGTKLGKVTTTEEHNAFGETKRLAASIDGKQTFVVDYERDALGRITKKTETIEGKTDTFVYEYDRAGRLTDVTKNGAKTSHYEYDANGNRLLHQGPNGIVKASYDNQDRLLRYGDAIYKHSANGEWTERTINGKKMAFNIDALGSLRSAKITDGTQIEYAIDGSSRRIGKKVDGKLVQGFLYQDLLKPIAELDAENRVLSRFVYAGKVNVPEYMHKGGKTYRMITDHLGSPRLVIDVATGAVVQRMGFDEFGNVVQDTNPGFQPFGFAGGLLDPHTQATRLGARDYDGFTGRWMTRDPIGFDGNDSNLFTYVNNNPVSLADPLGLFLWTPAGVGDAYNQARIDALIGQNPNSPSDKGWLNSAKQVFNQGWQGDFYWHGPGSKDPYWPPGENGPQPKYWHCFLKPGPLDRGNRDVHDVPPGMYGNPLSGGIDPQNPSNPPGSPLAGGIVIGRRF